MFGFLFLVSCLVVPSVVLWLILNFISLDLSESRFHFDRTVTFDSCGCSVGVTVRIEVLQHAF